MECSEMGPQNQKQDSKGANLKVKPKTANFGLSGGCLHQKEIQA